MSHAIDVNDTSPAVEPDVLASLKKINLRLNHEDVVFLGGGIKLTIRKTRSNRVDMLVEAEGVPVQLIRAGEVKVGRQFSTEGLDLAPSVLAE